MVEEVNLEEGKDAKEDGKGDSKENGKGDAIENGKGDAKGDHPSLQQNYTGPDMTPRWNIVFWSFFTKT